MGSNGNGNGNRGFENKLTLTRRDFLKTTAVATAAGGLLEVASNATPALAVENPTPTAVAKTTMTTCLCCSVGCGQLVDVDGSGTVLDIYGDPNHVVNAAANCPKGAAAILNVNGDRRLGVSWNQATGAPGGAVGTYMTGGPWKRTGNNSWTSISWTTAMSEIAAAMVAARDHYASGTAASATSASAMPAPGAPAKSNNGVAFLGCSHATNEENYLYRKLIANFGSTNTEHQARI